jgi:excisionase family DNA binding protein
VGHVTGQDDKSPRPALHRPAMLRPGQVARLLGVGRTTVHEAETRGDLVASRTPGGHRRYPADQPALADALAALRGPR